MESLNDSKKSLSRGFVVHQKTVQAVPSAGVVATGNLSEDKK